MQEPAPSVFASMQTLTPLLKYGRLGKPHYRNFELSADRNVLKWHSTKNKKKPTAVSIQSIEKVVLGRQTELFMKSNHSHPANLCFSLIYMVFFV